MVNNLLLEVLERRTHGEQVMVENVGSTFIFVLRVLSGSVCVVTNPA